MKCLILGASGRLGSRLMFEARKRGHHCTGTRFRTARPGLNRVDLRDGSAMTRLIRAERPEVIFIASGVGDALEAEAHPVACPVLERDVPVQAAQTMRDCYGDDPWPRPRVVYFSCPAGGSAALAQAKTQAEEALRLVMPDQHLIVAAVAEAGVAQMARAALDLVEGGRVGTCHVGGDAPLQREAA